jgi:hypothetical protein
LELSVEVFQGLFIHDRILEHFTLPVSSPSPDQVGGGR